MARYEVVVINGANDSTEQLQMETVYPLGGFFCGENRMQDYLDRGSVCAMVWDNEKDSRFYLANCDW